MDILYALAQNEQIWSVEKINLLKNYGVSDSKKQIKMRIHIKQIENTRRKKVIYGNCIKIQIKISWYTIYFDTF